MQSISQMGKKREDDKPSIVQSSRKPLTLSSLQRAVNSGGLQVNGLAAAVTPQQQQAVQQRQNIVANQGRVQELENEIADRNANQSFFDQARRVVTFKALDANTPESRKKRLKQGDAELYQDQQRDQGRRVIGNQNAANTIFGPTVQGINTVAARAAEFPEIVRGDLAMATGNDEALRASLARQQQNRENFYGGGNDGGYFGWGTIFDNPDEAMSPDSRHWIRGGSAALDATSFGVGGSLRRAGTQIYRQGPRKMIQDLAQEDVRRRAVREFGKSSYSGAAGSLGFEGTTNTEITPQSAALALTGGAVAGPLMLAGAPLLARTFLKPIFDGVAKVPAVYRNAADSQAAKVLSRQEGIQITPDDIAHARLSASRGAEITPTEAAQLRMERAAQTLEDFTPEEQIKIKEAQRLAAAERGWKQEGSQNSYITVKNEKTGEVVSYKPKTFEEYKKLVKQIDGDRHPSQSVEGSAGRRIGDKTYHVSAGDPSTSFLGDNTRMVNRLDVPQVDKTVKVKPGKATPGKTQRIGDLMPDNKKRTPTTRAAELSKKHGVKEETINRLEKQYGTERVEAALNRNADATNIKNKDAFITSELQKQYGKQAGGRMSDAELASLDSRAPDATAPKTTPKAPQVGKTVKVKPTSNVSAMEQRARAKGDGDIVDALKKKHANDPARYERALNQLDSAKKTEPTVKVVGGNRIDTTTGEVLGPAKTTAKTTKTRVKKEIADLPKKPSTPPKVPTGDKVVDEKIAFAKENTKFAQAVDTMPEPKNMTASRAAQIEKNAGQEVERLYKKIAQSLKKKGKTFEEFVDMVERIKDKDLAELRKAGLLDEFAAHRGIVEKLNELNPQFRVDDKRGLMYFPRIPKGATQATGNTLDSIISEFGQVKYRTGALTDYGKSPESMRIFTERAVRNRFRNVGAKPKNKHLRPQYDGSNKSYKPTDNATTIDGKKVSKEANKQYGQKNVENLSKEIVEVKKSEYGKTANFTDNLTSFGEKILEAKNVYVNKTERMIGSVRESVARFSEAKNHYNDRLLRVFEDNDVRRSRKNSRLVNELLNSQDRKTLIKSKAIPDNLVKAADDLMDIALEVRDGLRAARINNNDKLNFRTNFSETQGIFNIESYIDSSLKEIHLGQSVRTLESFANKLAIDGRRGDAEWLQNYVNVAFKNRASKFDQALGFGYKTKDIGGGVKVTTNQATKARRAAETLTRWRAEAALTLNPQFIVGTMPSSLAIVPKEARLKSTARGFLDGVIDPEARAIAKTNSEFRIKDAGGVVRMGYADGNAAIRTRGRVKQYAQKPTQMMENQLQIMSLSAGYREANRLGLSGMDADIFAARTARRTQSTYDPYNRTSIQNSLIFRAAAPFQTFYFEMNRQAQQILGIGGGKAESAGKRFHSAMNLMAGMFIMNETFRIFNDDYISGPGVFVPVFGPQVDAWIKEQKVTAMAYMDDNMGLQDLPLIGMRFEQAQLDKKTREFFEERNVKLKERLKELDKAANNASSEEKEEIKKEQQEIKETLARSRRNRFPLAPGEDFKNIADAILTYTRTGDSRPLEKQITFWGLGAAGIGGGSQANRMRDGIEAALAGEQETRRGNVAFPLDSNWDKLVAIFRGPYQSKPGREYLQGRRQALSEGDSEEWRNLMGNEARDFYEETQETYKKLSEVGDYRDSLLASLSPDKQTLWEASRYNFNAEYDDFDQEAADRLQQQKKRWNIYDANPEVFEVEKNVALKRAELFGTDVDPIYQLSDKDTRTFLKYQAINNNDPGGSEARDFRNKHPEIAEIQRMRGEHFDKRAKNGELQDFEGQLITPPEQSPKLKKLLEQYNNFEDPAERAQFGQANPEIFEYFNANAEYTNEKRRALGLPELDTRPQPSKQVRALEQQYHNLPSGTGERTRFVRANPELQNYWDELNEYNLARDASLAVYKGNTLDEDTYTNIARMARRWNELTGGGRGGSGGSRGVIRRARQVEARSISSQGRSGTIKTPTVKIQRGIRPKTIKMKRA